jgi:hypothetical protein
METLYEHELFLAPVIDEYWTHLRNKLGLSPNYHPVLAVAASDDCEARWNFLRLYLWSIGDEMGLLRGLFSNQVNGIWPIHNAYRLKIGHLGLIGGEHLGYNGGRVMLRGHIRGFGSHIIDASSKLDIVRDALSNRARRGR